MTRVNQKNAGGPEPIIAQEKLLEPITMRITFVRAKGYTLEQVEKLANLFFTSLRYKRKNLKNKTGFLISSWNNFHAILRLVSLFSVFHDS